MFPSTPPRRATSEEAGFSTPDRPTRPSTTSIKIYCDRALIQRALEETEAFLKATRASGPYAERGLVIASLETRITALRAGLATIERVNGLYPRPR